jgi:hypothetical protein
VPRRLAALAWATAAVALLAPALVAQDVKRVNPDAKAIAGFQHEITEFVEMRRKLEHTLPPLPSEASALQIDQRQRALAALIQKARRGAKQGDLFSSDVRPVIRRLLNGVFNADNGDRLRRVIMDENPGRIVKLEINGRYPDTIPLSSVPPQVLAALPPIGSGLEYRFIGTSLIILDGPSHIIVDYLTGAVPR